MADTEGRLDVILIGTGSEVGVALAARDLLAAQGVQARVVSMPSWELFDEQDAAYRESVLPAAVTARVSVEAGVTMGWERYVGSAGAMVGINRFGESGKGAGGDGTPGDHAGERGREGVGVVGKMT